MKTVWDLQFRHRRRFEFRTIVWLSRLAEGRAISEMSEGRPAWTCWGSGSNTVVGACAFNNLIATFRRNERRLSGFRRDREMRHAFTTADSNMFTDKDHHHFLPFTRIRYCSATKLSCKSTPPMCWLYDLIKYGWLILTCCFSFLENRRTDWTGSTGSKLVAIQTVELSNPFTARILFSLSDMQS